MILISGYYLVNIKNLSEEMIKLIYYGIILIIGSAFLLHKEST